MDLIAQTLRDWGLYFFIAVFSAVAIWETKRPFRQLSQSLRLRWLNNFAWLAIGWIALRALFPFAATQWGEVLDANRWGLFHYVQLPDWVRFVLGFMALDLGGYLLHALLHKSAILWRIHAIHHSDKDFDCSTGFRFHPVEAIIHICWRIALATLLGIGAFTILLYEFWVGLQNVYGHANASFAPGAERYLRLMVVTPDLHRVHHSANLPWSQTNFGILLPWWDRLFKTYSAPTKSNPLDTSIGLGVRYMENKSSVPLLLMLPFTKRFSDYF